MLRNVLGIEHGTHTTTTIVGRAYSKEIDYYESQIFNVWDNLQLSSKGIFNCVDSLTH